MKLLASLLLSLLMQAASAGAATGSESKACDTFNEGWNCTSNCWEKSKGPCAEGAGACQNNAKACGGSADAAASWASVALYAAAALALIGVGYYFIDKAMDDDGDLGRDPGPVSSLDADLLPSRAALDGA